MNPYIAIIYFILFGQRNNFIDKGNRGVKLQTS